MHFLGTNYDKQTHNKKKKKKKKKILADFQMQKFINLLPSIKEKAIGLIKRNIGKKLSKHKKWKKCMIFKKQFKCLMYYSGESNLQSRDFALTFEKDFRNGKVTMH